MPNNTTHTVMLITRNARQVIHLIRTGQATNMDIGSFNTSVARVYSRAIHGIHAGEASSDRPQRLAKALAHAAVLCGAREEAF